VTEQQPGYSSGKIPTAALVAVTVLLLAVLAAIVFLTAIGKDISSVLLLLSSLIAPTIASIVAVGKLSDVQHKVGEKVSNLITDKSNLEQQLTAAGYTPVTAKVSFDPDSTSPNIPRIGSDTAPISAAELIRRHSSG
jgi:hypothetical protein